MTTHKSSAKAGSVGPPAEGWLSRRQVGLAAGWNLSWAAIFTLLLWQNEFGWLMPPRRDIFHLLLPELMILALLCGGIGGALGSFYVLFRYTQEGPEASWNLVLGLKPFLGLLVGLISYLLVFTVAALFNVTAPNNSNALTMMGYWLFRAASLGFPFVAGVFEAAVWLWLGRVMRFIYRR